MNVWDFIYNKYNSNIDVILLYVLSSTGSSPGRRGFKMAVAADNTIEGSIGGGIMEHKFVEMARSVLHEKTVQRQGAFRQIHSKEEANNQSGMICSGEQTIFMHPINSADIEAIQKIIHANLTNTNATLLLTESGIDFLSEASIDNFSYEETSHESFLLKEKLGFKNTLHIIGGGHCALALSQLMSQMDFYIHIYEDRVDLNTLLKNKYAQKVHLVQSYAELDSLITESPQVFVVIMTFGYRTDDIAVRALLNKKFDYLGIMGSKKKIAQMFATYREEGIAEEKLARFHAPIGLQIKSQTPTEIAVSIAAEIIQVKNAMT